MIGATLAVVASGVALFVAPGAVVLAALGPSLRRGERLAFAFSISLALLTAAFALCLLLHASIAAGPFALAAVTLLAAALGRRLGTEATRVPGGDRSASPLPFACVALLLLAAFCVVAAARFAPVGSIDRWWYLAYVRGFAAPHALTLAEPFLGSGQAFARFGVHPWLFGLAAWSWLSGVDPVVIYESAAPVLVVLASLSAAWTLATTLFGAGRHARLTLLATMLLWSGAMVPLLARAGEDKVLASAALLPLCAAALLRVLRGDAQSSPTVRVALLFACALATAAVHALVYAFVLVALLPVAAWTIAAEPPRRRAGLTASTVLLVVAVAPAFSGLVVRNRLHDIGAELSSPDHPVVRVHEGRERLVEFPFVGFVVSPRLLLHPLALLALAGLPLLRRRNGEDSARFLVATTVIPLAIAFLPPLPRIAGTVIPPWMVYRVLWLLPLAPLAAIAADKFASRVFPTRREAAATALLLTLGLPVLGNGARERLAEVRNRLAAPSSAGFRGAVDAVAALPADALLVAAPELSERLPAFTARSMVAALDRSTIVFAGSRDLGEARLRARAALLAGDDDGASLARAAGVKPTHALFDTMATSKPACGAVLYQSGAYTLCRLALPPNPPAAVATHDAAAADCEALPPSSRRDPWSAAAPTVTCRLRIPAFARDRDDLALRIAAVTGRATDELRITLSGTAGSRRTTVRVKSNAEITVDLPRTDAEFLDVRIASSFLPAVKLTHVTLASR